jgi:hypothetical protein
MKSFLKILLARPQRLLLTIAGVITFSPYSQAAPLIVGDEYEGGRIFYIFQPGDKEYAETVDQAVILAKAETSSSLFWTDSRSSTDKLERIGAHGQNVQGSTRQARLVRWRPLFSQ